MFIDLLDDEKNAMFVGKTALKLLAALCSCNEIAILDNQLTIFEMLLQRKPTADGVQPMQRLVILRNLQNWRLTAASTSQNKDAEEGSVDVERLGLESAQVALLAARHGSG